MREPAQDSSDSPGAVLRRLRYTAGRRVSQRTLATLAGTSRAHIARLELHGYPPLTDEQLDRIEKAGDAISPPFSRDELHELRRAMQTVEAAAVRQAEKAVKDIGAGMARIFPRQTASPEPGRRGGKRGVPGPLAGPGPFASGHRPAFLTTEAEIVAAAQADIRHLISQRRTGSPGRPSPEPDLIMTSFGQRSLVDMAAEPEQFRDTIRAALQEGATVEHLIAPPAAQSAHDLVALVPPMISYLGQGGEGYRVHVIPELEHALAYDICVAGDRGLLVVHGDSGRAVAVRTDDPGDVAALRDMLRGYWEGKRPIAEEAGRRTRESVTGRTPEPSVGLRFEHVLTSVELEEGPRRLAKNGLSILNVPVAIHAWKWRAAELCTARRIPGDLLQVLHAHAWELAAHGLAALPADVLEKYSHDARVHEALQALDKYARSLQVRQAAWADQLSRHDFWDACPKSALTRFFATGELPRDEIPSACTYVAEPGDIEIIVSRLITRLRSHRNYHLALIEEEPAFPQWFYFEVKGTHLLAQVFDSPTGPPTAAQVARSPDESMLSVHFDYAPIATAFAGWFDEHVLRAAATPSWQDNRGVASWLENEFGAARGKR